MNNVALPKVKSTVETACLVVVILAVLALFSVPVILYYVNLNPPLESDSPERNVSKNSTSITPQQIEQPMKCSSQNMIERVPGTQCRSEVYTGQSCMQQLATTQSCTLQSREPVMVAVLGQQQQNERMSLFNTTLDFLNRFSHSQCISAAESFLCQYLFPLCDNTTGGLYLPTQEECLRISQQVCSQEWNLARLAGFGDQLPDCSTLPLLAGSGSALQAIPNNSVINNITCREGFIDLNNTCYARCDRWTIQDGITSSSSPASMFVSSITALIGGFTFLVAAAVKYKQMFIFPMILLVYVTVVILIGAFFILLAQLGSPALLCSSTTIVDSINNPTALCIISGAAFHYSLVSMTLFWFFHVCMFFYKINFPFYSNAHRSKEKYIHVVMAALGFLLPIPAIIVALTGKDYHYTVASFPPIVCVTRSGELWFYSTNLVIDIIVAVALCLLVIVFWKVRIHKRRVALKSNKRKQLFSTAEKKLLLVFCYFITVICVALIYFSIFTAYAETLMRAIAQHFACEAPGYVPGKCDRAAYQQYYNTYWWFSNITIMLIGFIPAVNLVFVVNFQETRKRLSVFWAHVMTMTRVASSSGNQSSQQCDKKLAAMVNSAKVTSSSSPSATAVNND